MRSRLFPFPTEPRWRRLFSIAIFLGLLVSLRHLAFLFVCFVLLSRGLGALASLIERRINLHRRRVLASLLGVAALAFAGGILLVVRSLSPFVARAQMEWRTWFETLAANPALVRVRELTGLSGSDLVDAARDHGRDALTWANSTAHVLLYLVIGLIVAIMFLFEHEELLAWRRGLLSRSIADTLLRWFGYVADAIVVTARMQGVVALVNALVTLPVLLILGLKHVAMLSLLILVSGRVPVVGNIISGAVLCVVAYESRGAWAVAVFVGSTFVLHKIESYYLNPRLAAEHVRLPALILVGSLILFEHFLGLPGLFLSFPALYVGSRIHHEWIGELEEETPAAPGLAAGT